MRISTKLAIALALVALSGALPHATGLSDPPHFHPGLPLGAAASAAQDDVDAFMEKVLEKREINWDQVYDYVFGEVEKLRIRGVEIADEHQIVKWTLRTSASSFCPTVGCCAWTSCISR